MMNIAESISSGATGLYAKHYAILREIAERLRAGGAVDIDMLLEDSRKAAESYEICCNRLEAIRAELKTQRMRSHANYSFREDREDSTI